MWASSFFQHEFLIVESNSVDNLLFSGKRVTANILKGTDQIPESFGTALGVKNSGLVDIVVENRNELKNTIVTLSKIILKKDNTQTSNVREAHENPEDFKKIASTAS